MKCKESSILKTENVDKNWNFQEIFKIFFAYSVQNHEDIVESDNNIVKITDNYDKLILKNKF